MSDTHQDSTENKIQRLLALAEEKISRYQREKACDLYAEAIKLLAEEDAKTSADLYFKLGQCSYFASYCAKTLEDAVQLSRLSSLSYEKSKRLYKSIGGQGRALECIVMISLLEIHLSKDADKILNFTKKNSPKLENAIRIYLEKDEKQDYARAVALQYYINSFPVCLQNKHRDILAAFEKIKPLTEKCWEIVKETGEAKNYIPLTFFIFGNLAWLGGAGYNLPSRFCAREIYRAEEIGEELLVLMKKTDDDWLLALSYIINCMAKWFLAVLALEKENDRKAYFDQVVSYADRGLVHAEKIGLNFLISLFYSHRSPSLLWGNATVDLERILHDIDLSIKHDKLHLHHFFHLNHIFSSNIYTELAHLTFVPVEDRRAITKKSLDVLENTLQETGLGVTTKSIPLDAALYAGLCLNYVRLAEFSSGKKDREKYIDKALKEAASAKSAASGLKGGLNQSYAYNSIWFACKSMADISKSARRRKEMLKMAVDAAEKLLENPVLARTGDLSAKTRLGDLYLELGVISKDEEMLKKAHDTFLKALDDAIKRGSAYMTASAHQRIAFVEESRNDHEASADSYLKAHDAYKEALASLFEKNIVAKVKERCAYSLAWHLIEVARACHDKEQYHQAREKYEAAGAILKDLPTYHFESSYYSAWAVLEDATHAGKEERHFDAAENFEIASGQFDKVINILNTAQDNAESLKEKNRIGKLEKAACLRKKYALARAALEKGSGLGKEGKKLEAARQYRDSAVLFEEIVDSYELDTGKEGYLGILKLCQALEKMELAENENDPDGYKEAAILFEQAGDVFLEKKKKMMAQGNAAFCKALENGCRFDEFEDTETKTLLYTKIKKHLRNAASFYRQSGFLNGADWALAASAYFDGAWHLIQADEILDLNERKKLLEVAAQYLKSAAGIFGRSGYWYREKEILDRLDMLNEESKILVSAMDAIAKPAISDGFSNLNPSALAEETSSSVSISEMRRYSREMEQKAAAPEEQKYSIVYNDQLDEDSRIQQTKCRVGIAQTGAAEDFFEEKTDGLFGLPQSRLAAVRQKVKIMCEKARENKVDILLFPEMLLDLNYRELLEDLFDLAKTGDMIIVPGAYHDLETKANTCRVIGPEGIVWEQKKHIPAIIGMGEEKHKENIQTDSPGRITICNTRFGRIAIAICRDFLDMDLRVELKNSAVPVDIILNTAFTPVTSDFEAAHFEARRSIYAYCFFCNHAFFGNSQIHSPEKNRTKMVLPPREENLIFKDIDLFNLRSERKKWEKIRDSEVSFIQSTR
ncbi:MAG: carbon-nitrogen hydrolase family protein [Deltaproteobacteria bacterium]|nr:carbon-nitrogen hydrolase family protein [Deltaproteobacteria bacterium]